MQLRAMFGKLIMRYQEIAFQDMPHTPGLDLALNSFMSFFTEKIPHPTRLIRLADKNSDNSGKVIFYQASTAFSTRNLQEAKANQNQNQNQQLIDAVDYKDLSASILCSLITGSGELKPEDVMIRFTTRLSEEAVEEQLVDIAGINVVVTRRPRTGCWTSAASLRSLRATARL